MLSIIKSSELDKLDLFWVLDLSKRKVLFPRLFQAFFTLFEIGTSNQIFNKIARCDMKYCKGSHST